MYSKIRLIALVTVTITSVYSFSAELSLNGIVPAVSEAHGNGWTAGFPAGGFASDNHTELYAGYWEPLSYNGDTPPYIATNALIFPAKNATLLALQFTNITWHIHRIYDDIDNTNVLISAITLYCANTTNEITTITNNIENIRGGIQWFVPPVSWDGMSNYVLRFNVVDSSSLTNSLIFWDNTFTIVPEPALLLSFISLIFFLLLYRTNCYTRH